MGQRRVFDQSRNHVIFAPGVIKKLLRARDLLLAAPEVSGTQPEYEFLLTFFIERAAIQKVARTRGGRAEQQAGNKRNDVADLVFAHCSAKGRRKKLRRY